MKAGWLLPLLFLCTLSGKSQPVSLDELGFSATDTLKGAYKPAPNRKHIFVTSSFGKAEVAANRNLDSISGFLINEIVLVYSQYKKSDQFSQHKLNQARWSNLLKTYPSFFQSNTTKLRNVCQAGVDVDSLAKELTHGFYIYYENVADPVHREAEIKAVAEFIAELGIDTSASSVTKQAEPVSSSVPENGRPRRAKPLKTKDPNACRQPYYKNGHKDLDDFFVRNIDLNRRQKKNFSEVSAELQLRLDHNGQIRSAHVMSRDDEFIQQIKVALSKMTLWHPAVLNGVAISTTVRLNLRANPNGFVHMVGAPVLARALASCGLQPDEEIFDFSDKPGEPKMPGAFVVDDSKLLKNVAGRNKDLDSILLVVDLTGSMGPYIAQVLEMMTEMVEKNDKRILSIALFNDGNNRPDRSKKIGSTGGIIVLKGDITAETLSDAVLKSMKRGNGGDVMENNIEAVLEGLRQCPGCRRVLLVCDNFATPRDGSLLPQVKVPIHWIMCGALSGINTNYMDLVRQNKGVLHTGRSDVRDLHKIGEDQTIVIDGYSYKLAEGKFRLLQK